MESYVDSSPTPGPDRQPAVPRRNAGGIHKSDPKTTNALADYTALLEKCRQTPNLNTDVTIVAAGVPDRQRPGISASVPKGPCNKSTPANWPLIRQVQVKCDAPALSTGAVLVDLPGVADANAARNEVARKYMEKCQHIWVLAPICRAVDDRTARGKRPSIFTINQGIADVFLLRPQ